jgi:hypothetical protein
MAEPAAELATSLADFLEKTPPDTTLRVGSLAVTNPYGRLILDESDIRLPCDSQGCAGKGELQFAHTSDSTYLTGGKWKFDFVTYTCRNCQNKRKVFALAALLDSSGFSGSVMKLGEIPAFGPQVPARVITLIGPDREIFLKGRRSENHGLGIGAFGYYRRVVENQKTRIIQEMAKVAKKLGAPESDLRLFEVAVKETQFSLAIDKIKAAIPSALRIDGHNPLTLLHDALSDGLHARSDEECLEYAREIRLVLTELAERMAQVLKENSELRDAVSKLLARASKKTSSAVEPQ